MLSPRDSPFHTHTVYVVNSSESVSEKSPRSMVFAEVGGGGASFSSVYSYLTIKCTFSPKDHESGEGYTQHLCSEQTFRDCGLIKQTKRLLLPSSANMWPGIAMASGAQGEKGHA